jgi:hypothetical protein
MGSSGISSGGTCAPATLTGKSTPINSNAAATDVSAALRRARKGCLIPSPPFWGTDEKHAFYPKPELAGSQNRCSATLIVPVGGATYRERP